jgi:hypothetical protein
MTSFLVGPRSLSDARRLADETYRAGFAEKLGLKSRADIVRYALERGLLTTEKLSTSKNAPPHRARN